MFSKSIRWKIQKETVQLNDAPIGEQIPKITLKDRDSSTTISLCPYRIIFEPCTPSDAYCRLEVRLSTLNDLLHEINENSSYLNSDKEQKDTKCNWIFGITERESINYYLNKLEDHLLRTTYKYRTNLMTEFNLLRKFVKLPARTCYPARPVNTNDVEMDFSAFWSGLSSP